MWWKLDEGYRKSVAFGLVLLTSGVLCGIGKIDGKTWMSSIEVLFGILACGNAVEWLARARSNSGGGNAQG